MIKQGLTLRKPGRPIEGGGGVPTVQDPSVRTGIGAQRDKTQLLCMICLRKLNDSRHVPASLGHGVIAKSRTEVAREAGTKPEKASPFRVRLSAGSLPRGARGLELAKRSHIALAVPLQTIAVAWSDLSARAVARKGQFSGGRACSQDGQTRVLPKVGMAQRKDRGLLG